MIPGLEYEQPPSNNNGYTPSSPSPSLQSVEMSPHYGLHRRHAGNGSTPSNSTHNNANSQTPDKYTKRTLRNIDLFPKLERDYEVRTDRGGWVTLVGMMVVVVLVLAEVGEWRRGNGESLEGIVVDTSVNKKMKVYLNITFPSLHCDDLHLDVIDVAGDSQLNLSNGLYKLRLNPDGSLKSSAKISTEANIKHDQDKKRQEALTKKLPADYCGPCYGAHENDHDCCNTCDDVLNKYKAKRWNADAVMPLSEQCIREGRGKNTPKKMSTGEGCNLHGYFTVNRVAGNFHIAMGEGVDRGGAHIHNFLPEDRVNFNASHVIHELVFTDEEFGGVVLMSEEDVPGQKSMNSVKKVVTEETGVTGLFQYYIKIVPTKYKGDILKQLNLPFKPEGDVLETNRFFYTERFRPLIGEVHEEAYLTGDRDQGTAGVHVGGKTGGTLHEKVGHHDATNAILPGVFFVYEIYPFAVEVTKNQVPFIHLLIRIVATAGGVFTIMRWIDGALYSREKKGNR